jgi:hypothetical protein
MTRLESGCFLWPYKKISLKWRKIICLTKWWERLTRRLAVDDGPRTTSRSWDGDKPGDGGIPINYSISQNRTFLWCSYWRRFLSHDTFWNRDILLRERFCNDILILKWTWWLTRATIDHSGIYWLQLMAYSARFKIMKNKIRAQQLRCAFGIQEMH